MLVKDGVISLPETYSKPVLGDLLKNRGHLGIKTTVHDDAKKNLKHDVTCDIFSSNGVNRENTDEYDIVDGHRTDPQTISAATVSCSIIDIRRDNSTTPLANLIRGGLKPPSGDRKVLAPLTLWDSQGLALFEQITKLPDYYLSRVEYDILHQNQEEIAQKICFSSVIIDLGCGDTEKTTLLLQVLDDMCLPLDYYALDLSLPSLHNNLARLSFRHIRCHGLLGTFDDARHWLQTPAIRNRSKCLLSLGSTIGNMTREEAASFLRGFVEALKPAPPSSPEQLEHQPQPSPLPGPHPESLFLIGLDSCTHPALIRKAYSDPTALNARFILNALTHANTVLGHDAFSPGDWSVCGEWSDGGYYQFLVPTVDGVEFEGRGIEKGEKVQIVQSLKYDGEQQSRLWEDVGLDLVGQWVSGDERFGSDPMVSLLKVGDEMMEDGFTGE